MDGETRAKLHYHLEYNCYPAPVPELIDLIETAIERCDDGDSDASLATMPDGHVVTAGELVEAYHCDFFVDRWTD